ncbi:amidase [Actinomadura fulvescens]|uniref:Amidase n=1 Tax=Actinomadura fulvescens TaxID=46160 RepID=A0ABP6CES4_9ACTN
MPVHPPAADQLRQIAERCGLSLSEEDLSAYRNLILDLLPAYTQVERMAAPRPATSRPRTPGHRPAPETNPLNAWYWRCSLRGADDGPLAGRTVAIKDSVAVAGVPMANGSHLLEGHVPDFDATLVTRVLDAGGHIVGKAAGEDLGFSGGSHTCHTGPIRNPWNLARSVGGSSGGSAALVAHRDVDLAVGGDQGGSLREPASWCGIVGLKGTYGLVPYTGVFPLEITLDHIGPMGRDVAGVAALLEAIAGTDGFDPRQPPGLVAEPYTRSLAEPLGQCRVLMVDEGFGWPAASQDAVDEAVRDAAYLLEKAGASVERVSIPPHRSGYDIWTAIAYEGAAQHMLRGGTCGTNWKGYYDTALLGRFTGALRTRPQDLPSTVKLLWLMGEYLTEHYHGRYYALAQNLVPVLARAYDDALAEADVLAMPTVPMTATTIPPPDASLEESMAATMRMGVNTAPFSVTGHPAVTVPCGVCDGLPVGLMLVGKRWDDARVLRVARAFEERVGGFPTPPAPISDTARP